MGARLKNTVQGKARIFILFYFCQSYWPNSRLMVHLVRINTKGHQISLVPRRLTCTGDWQCCSGSFVPYWRVPNCAPRKGKLATRDNEWKYCSQDTECWGWKDGFMVKGTRCSSRRPGSIPTSGSSQATSWILATKEGLSLAPFNTSSGIHIYTHRQTQAHTNNLK